MSTCFFIAPYLSKIQLKCLAAQSEIRNHQSETSQLTSTAISAKGILPTPP